MSSTVIQLSVGCWHVTAFPDTTPGLKFQHPKCWRRAAKSLHLCCSNTQNTSWHPSIDIHYTLPWTDPGPQTHIFTLIIAGIPHIGETCEIPHEAWLHTESIQLLQSLTRNCFLNKSIRLAINISPLSSELRRIKKQSNETSASTHPLPPPPLIPLTFSVLPSLFRELFALFITCFESSFYSLFVLLLFPVLVSHCVLSISLSLCESLLCWGVSAYIGLPVSVGVWFTRIFLTMTSTIVATFFPYGHCLSAVCVLLTADETHNRTENQAWNRNVLGPFFKLLSVLFSHVFQNMMVSVIK